MGKLGLTLIVITSLCNANFSYGADRFVTLKTNAANSFTDSINVAANEIAQIVTATACSDGYFKVTIGADVFDLPGTSASNQRFTWFTTTKPNWFIVGPATITYDTETYKSLATIKIQPNPNINGVGQ